MNKRIPSHRSNARQGISAPQGDLQALMALRALRLPGAPPFPKATDKITVVDIDGICPYCGSRSLIVHVAGSGQGHLTEGVCAQCGTRSRCYAAPQETLRLPWIVASEVLA